MALKKEENASHPYDSSQGFPQSLHSALLENLIAEILLFFSIRFDSLNIYKKLNGLIITINRWCMPKFNARLLFPPQPKLDEIEEEGSDNDVSNPQSREQSASISNQNSDSKYRTSSKISSKKRIPDFLNLSTIDKLKLLCFLIDAQLACAHDANQLDETFSDDKQRIIPIAIDNSGRKFWYFCDTWLFIEEGNLFDVEKEEEKVTDLLNEAIESRRMFIKKMSAKKNNKNDIRKYLKNKHNKEIKPITIEKPKGTFTQRVLDEANKNLCTCPRFRVVAKNSDQLSNLIQAYTQGNANRSIIKKFEECLHCIQEIEKENIKKLEQEALIRQSSRIAILNEKKRQKAEESRRKALELAKLKKEEDEQKYLTESAFKLCEQSREQRLMKRQQRIQEQLDQEQLVEAGIILPSSRSPDKDELSSVGSSTEENDYCKSYKPVKKMPRLPAYDWWNPVTSPEFDGSDDAGIFRTLFRRKESDKKLSNILGKSLLKDDRRISLIASSSKNNTTESFPSSKGNQSLFSGDIGKGRKYPINSKNSLNPKSFYGSSVNGFDKIRNALNLTKMDDFDTSEDSFMQTSRKWAAIHPASLLGCNTPADNECSEDGDDI
uniref:Uncharacterized protein n=2 Tax=Meloidogyne incognita group TaxID=654580 RepID=A0A914MEV2_MELIC